MWVVVTLLIEYLLVFIQQKTHYVLVGIHEEKSFHFSPIFIADRDNESIDEE